MDNQLQLPNLNCIFADFNAKMPAGAYIYTSVQLEGINRLRIDIIKQKMLTALTGNPVEDVATDAFLRGQLAILDMLLENHHASTNPEPEME